MTSSAPDYAIVVPTVGRESLRRLLVALERGPGPAPAEVVLVDDRPDPGAGLPVTAGLPIRVLRSGGRGPAAARNAGWRATTARWVCFLDDDVLPHASWKSALAADLRSAEAAGAVGSQAVIEVPAANSRRPTDDERRTLRLAQARWITADMAYRRDTLVAVGGFDKPDDKDLLQLQRTLGNLEIRGAMGDNGGFMRLFAQPKPMEIPRP